MIDPKQLESDERGERWRIRGDQMMAGVHKWEDCEGSCVLHNPSDHHMRGWKLHWRQDRHMFERICSHGVGHPDPDDDHRDPRADGVHGCDGCCMDGS